MTHIKRRVQFVQMRRFVQISGRSLRPSRLVSLRNRSFLFGCADIQVRAVRRGLSESEDDLGQIFTEGALVDFVATHVTYYDEMLL